MQGEIFANSHRHCVAREGGEDGHFWCKKGIEQSFCPGAVGWSSNNPYTLYRLSTTKSLVSTLP